MNQLTHDEPIGEAKLTQKEIGFIKEHIGDDVNKLLLKGFNERDLDFKKLINQIHARQKAAKKLPEWTENDQIIFPQALSVEQSSSEAAARYKASLVSGERLIDITGGMGVDCFYMSSQFEHTDYFEMQESVASTAAHNFELLGATNIHVHAANSLDTLAHIQIQADWIYTDPARRSASNQKVVVLADCTPDIIQNLTLLMKCAPKVMLKTSPLLDIDLAVSQLACVREVHVIGYDQECKELLFILDKSIASTTPEINAVILNRDGSVSQKLVFSRSFESGLITEFSAPLAYLYEPHPAMLKAGAFKTIAAHYGLKKLAANSHLYTSHTPFYDFPGRTFKTVSTCKPDSNKIKSHIEEGRANLTVRNFPGNIHDLRKKWRLKDGGDFYLFATTLYDKSKVVIVTKKVIP